MAKRKDLKKNISAICGELFMECVALAHYNKNVNKESIDKIMTEILYMQNDFINRISHPDPVNTKMFFSALRKDFNRQTEHIIENLSQLS